MKNDMFKLIGFQLNQIRQLSLTLLLLGEERDYISNNCLEKDRTEHLTANEEQKEKKWLTKRNEKGNKTEADDKDKTRRWACKPNELIQRIKFERKMVAQNKKERENS